MNTRISARRAARLRPVLLLLGLALVSDGAAHAVVVESQPTNGAALHEPPVDLVLRFNATIEPAMTVVKLGSPGASPQRLPARTDGAHGRVEAALPVLAPGVYTVTYQVLATDGHVTEGSIRFTVLSAQAP